MNSYFPARGSPRRRRLIQSLAQAEPLAASLADAATPPDRDPTLNATEAGQTDAADSLDVSLKHPSADSSPTIDPASVLAISTTEPGGASRPSDTERDPAARSEPPVERPRAAAGPPRMTSTIQELHRRLQISPQLTWLCTGEWSTQRESLAPAIALHWPHFVRARLGRIDDLIIHALSRDGGAAALAESLPLWLSRFKPDVVWIFPAARDLASRRGDLKSIEEHWRELIDACHRRGALAIAVQPPELETPSRDESIRRAAWRATCLERGALYIDAQSALNEPASTAPDAGPTPRPAAPAARRPDAFSLFLPRLVVELELQELLRPANARN